MQNIGTRTKIEDEKKQVQARRLPWIIPEQCEGCAACVAKCPTKCLSMNKTRHHGVEVPWLDQPDACIGCGKCEQACLMGAITITGYTDMAKLRLANKKKILEAE